MKRLGYRNAAASFWLQDALNAGCHVMLHTEGELVVVDVYKGERMLIGAACDEHLLRAITRACKAAMLTLQNVEKPVEPEPT